MLMEFQTLHTLLCAQQELGQLIQWAERKNLPSVAKAYENRLGDIQQRLVRYTIRQPRLTRLLRLHFIFYRFVLPPTRYYKQGSAAKFRRENFLPRTA